MCKVWDCHSDGNSRLLRCDATSMGKFIVTVFHSATSVKTLTLSLLTLRILGAPNNASRWQMGFNLVFKGLISPWTAWPWICGTMILQNGRNCPPYEIPEDVSVKKLECIMPVHVLHVLYHHTDCEQRTTCFVRRTTSLTYSLMSVARHWNLRPWFLWQESWVVL